MQSENFDKKIRESLSQRPPGNDNPAWDKMEPLLDQHMPQEKKDRRKIFFILCLFLLIGGGILFIWKNGDGDKNNISAIESQDKNSSPENNKNTAVKNVESNTINTTDNQPKNESAQTVNTNDQTTKTQKTEVPGVDRSATRILADPEFTIANPAIAKTKKNRVENKISTDNSTSIEKQIPEEEKETQSKPAADVAIKENNPVNTEKQQANKTGLPETNKEIKNTEQKQETKGSQPLTTEKNNSPKPKNKRSFFDNLFFSLSAGADLSTVGVDNIGRVKPVAGAGIGYQMSNRFTIRTGFYSARKIYTADPEDYHPPYDLAAYYPNLKTIDANCKVYEVPLAIDYTISKNKKQSWFVSGGASTLIMKKETYDYYYKPNSSPTYITYRRTINDENKHYFSVLSLSAGYSRNINRNLRVQAEPYFKIAMKGVGYGKVNLNSGGVLVSAVIKPFAKK